MTLKKGNKDENNFSPEYHPSDETVATTDSSVLYDSQGIVLYCVSACVLFWNSHTHTHTHIHTYTHIQIHLNPHNPQWYRVHQLQTQQVLRVVPLKHHLNHHHLNHHPLYHHALNHQYHNHTILKLKLIVAMMLAKVRIFVFFYFLIDIVSCWLCFLFVCLLLVFERDCWVATHTHIHTNTNRLW